MSEHHVLTRWAVCLDRGILFRPTQLVQVAGATEGSIVGYTLARRSYASARVMTLDHDSSLVLDALFRRHE